MNLTLQSIKGLVAALLFVSVASCSGSGSNTPTGVLTFWTDETMSACPDFRVFVDGVDLGIPIFRVPEPLKCGDFGDPRAISRNVAEGTRIVTGASASGILGCTFEAKEFKVDAGSCQFVRFFIP